MKPPADSAGIFNYHEYMILQHGSESNYALGWRDTESQLIRFKTLAGIANLSGHSILDAGCGYGDLLPYLSTMYGQVVYTGIEQIPALFNEALTRHHNYSNASFIFGNFINITLPVSDYVMASGSLNYKSSDPQFIFKAIERLYESCTYGFAFNLLRTISSEGILVAYDPFEILNYASSLCREAKLIADYADEDFTIFMYR
jgi:SAM-dependent methyltransferase